MNKGSRIYTILNWAIPIFFILWCIGFIFRSSFVAFNGERYYSLFDDAMISMRYAWNLSHGNGLVWNQGIRVEGYSNLLMTLIMTVATFLFSKTYAVLSIQVLGILFLIGNGFLAVRIGEVLIAQKKAEHRVPVQILILIGVLAYYPLPFWSLMGMETGLLTFLLLLGIYHALMYENYSERKSISFCSLAFGFAFLARNDSIIYAGIIFALLLGSILYKGNRRTFIFTLKTILVIYSVFVIGQFLFRYIYYGEFVPNTYVLKLVGMPLNIRLSNGIGFIKPFIITLLPLLFFILLDILTDFKRHKLYLLLMPGAAILYQVYVGGDPWVYWRITAPAMPLFLILFCTSAYFLLMHLKKFLFL